MSAELLPAQEERVPRPVPEEFDFIYEDSDEIVSKVKKGLEGFDENPYSLEMSVMQLHIAAEKASKKILRLFYPLIKKSVSRHLSLNLNTLDGSPYFLPVKDFYSGKLSGSYMLPLMESRNSIAHGDTYEITQSKVEDYVKNVEYFMSRVKSATCEHWNELLIHKDLGWRKYWWNEDHRKEWEERFGAINQILWDGLWERNYDWVNYFFEEDDWCVYTGRPPEDFKPKLPIGSMDFVVGFQEEASEENPCEVYLVGRFFVGSDLFSLSTRELESLLGKDIEVLLFFPEKLKEEFLEKLGSLKSRIKFITYNYDQNGELTLNYTLLKKATN